MFTPIFLLLEYGNIPIILPEMRNIISVTSEPNFELKFFSGPFPREFAILSVQENRSRKRSMSNRGLSLKYKGLYGYLELLLI